MNITYGNFEWWEPKNSENINKHGIDFRDALTVFDDQKVLILNDTEHSQTEERYFAIGRISNGDVITVRFTNRERLRIFGANKSRKDRKRYENETTY